jgi:hypothetical protein
MNDQDKLNIIKIIHTLIWLFFNIVLVYLFYEVFIERITPFFWMGIGFILLESIILVTLRWTCPLTILARKYSTSTKENFDIYLPLWVAKHNKTIYTTLFTLLVIAYIWKIGI